MEKRIDMNENFWNFHKDNPEKRKPKLATPTVIDSEIELNTDSVLLSITDPKGIITYCNKDFVEVSGYEEWELAGAAHNIIRHPDMPRVIFKLMWQRIQNKNNIIAIVKNLAKSGKFYWVMTDFEIKEDEQGNIYAYKAYRKPAPRKAIKTLTPIYQKLVRIEYEKGMFAAENYFVGYLDSLNTTYDDFIENLIIDNVDIHANELEETTKNSLSKKQRKSFFKRLFGY